MINLGGLFFTMFADTAGLDKANSSLNNLSQSVNKADSSVKNLTKSMKAAAEASLLTTGHFGGMSTRLFALSQLIDQFGVKTAIVTGVLSGLGGAALLLGDAGIKAAQKMQATQIALTAVTGSAAVANTQLIFIKDTALQAGVAFDATAQSYSKFLASASNSGLSLGQTQKSFRELSLAIGTLHLSPEQAQGTFVALEQMLSKGKVSSEELRRQLGNSLPGAFQIAAKAVGVTTQELDKMIRQGQVLSRDFVPKFTEALMAAYHIDANKSVDSLTASLSRLSTNWTLFLLAIDQATGASKVFKIVVDAVSGAFSYMSGNMQQVIGYVGALTGALAGLGVVMALPTLVTVIASFGSFIALLGEAASLTEALTVVQMGLNVAMTANPVGAFVKILITLGAAIGGAIAGYDLFSSAVAKNQQLFTDTSAIQAYIAQQNKLTTATAAATAEMMKQIAAQNTIDSANAAKAGLKAAAVQAGGVSIMDRFHAMVDQAQKAGAGVGGGKSSTDVFADRVKAANAEADAAVAQARQTADEYAQLQNIYAKQAVMKPPTFTVAEPGVKGRHSIDRFDDIIQGAKDAQARLNELAKGPANFKLIDDLDKARKAINGLDPIQVGKLNARLNEMGLVGNTSFNSLVARITPFITLTREATTATEVFMGVWRDIQNGQVDLAAAGAKLNFLGSGGNPDKMYHLDSLAKAQDALRDIARISNTSIKNTALTAIKDSLHQIGIEGDTAEQALSNFFDQQERAKMLVETLTQLATAMRAANDNFSDTGKAMDAYRQGAAIGEAAEQALARADKVREFARALDAAGVSQQQINELTTPYLEQLRQIDAQSTVFQRLKTFMEGVKDAAVDAIGSISDTFISIADGSSKAGAAIKSLEKTLLDSGLKTFIQVPLQNSFQSLLTRVGNRGAAGIDNGQQLTASEEIAKFGNAVKKVSNPLSLFGSKSISGTTAINTMSGAALAAATALNQLAVSSGGKGSGGGILDILGKVAGVFAASQGGGDALAGLSLPGLNTTPNTDLSGTGIDFRIAAPRAFGGPGLAGNMYRVREQGYEKEYFQPSVNGDFVRSSGGDGSGGHTFHIDASTVIHAPGADPQAIAQLRQEMRARDSRIRTQLPAIIDQRVRDSSARRRLA